jgi:hypothetical protein
MRLNGQEYLHRAVDTCSTLPRKFDMPCHPRISICESTRSYQSNARLGRGLDVWILPCLASAMKARVPFGMSRK